MKTGQFLRGALFVALPLMGALSLLSACGGDDDDNGSTPATGAASGKLIAEKNACASCHGTNYAGMSFYPNITNDSKTGIGTWTDAEIKAAIHDGKDKDGGDLCSTMQKYDLTDAQLNDLVAYLRSLSVANEITKECEELSSPPSSRGVARRALSRARRGSG